MRGLNVLPPPELRSFVRAVQYMDVPPSKDGFVIPAQDRSMLILPAHTEYIIGGEIADKVSIEAATLLGPHDVPILNRTQLPVRGFTVDFTPLGAEDLLGIPQGEIANRGIPAELLLASDWVRELVERVNLAKDVPTALEAIYGLLVQMAAQSRGPRESVARRALRRPDKTPVDAAGAVTALAAQLDVSPRHLNREFHRPFGMGPRRYSIIRRLQTAMADLSAGAVENLTALAIEHGFYDYPHFSHEFKRFTLTTPAQFHGSHRHREYQVVAGEPAGS